jgi:6-phosphogluconolactonase/glucosamine-6-phosphate isomerase/deaminase
MGMRTILNSKRIISIIKGKNMLKILKKIIKGGYDENSIFTCLLLHKDVSIYIDNELYGLLNE